MSWWWLLYLPPAPIGGHMLLAAVNASRALPLWQRGGCWLVGAVLWPVMMLCAVAGFLLMLDWRRRLSTDSRGSPYRHQ
jgi:hypothetical protein